MSIGRSIRGRTTAIAVVLGFLTLLLPAVSNLRDGSIGAAGGGLSVSIGSSSIVVPAKGKVAIFFPVTLSRPSTSTVTVAYRTHDGTAKSGSSYGANVGVIKFTVDPKTGVTPITEFAGAWVYASPYGGGGGKFSMTLSRAVGAGIGNSAAVGTILGRASGKRVRVSAGDMSLYGGTRGKNRLGLVLITLSRPAPKPIRLRYTIVGRGATSGANFHAAPVGTLQIAAGAQESWVIVPIVSGSVTGSAKGLTVRLIGASGATLSRASGRVKIVPEPKATASKPAVGPPPSSSPGSGGSPGAPGAPSAGPSIPDPGGSSPAPNPATMQFDDEFNGAGLNTSNWQPNWLGNNDATITKPINGSELSCYDPAQVAQPGDGYLHLSAVARSCRANDGVTYSYASGLVESKPHFTFTYGYMEARMYLPANGGRTANWPAFWTDGTGTWPTTGELDVFEGLHGNDCWHFHSPSGGPGGCASLGDPTGWHTFGARWEPGKVTFYYDGNQVGVITSGITGAPMYPILNLGVGGEGGAVVVPSTVLVDYVRISK